MWQADTTLAVYIGASRVDAGIWRRGSWVAGSSFHCAIAVPGDRESLDSCLRLLASAYADGKVGFAAGSAPLQVRILLADAWLLSLSVPWSDGAAFARQPRDRARLAFADAGMEVGDDDVLRLAVTGYRQPFWAVAYPHGLLQVLDVFSVACGGRLASAQPLALAVVQAMNGAGKFGNMLALVGIDDVSLWSVAGRCPNLQLSALFSEYPGESRASVLELMQRRARLRDPRFAADAQLTVFDAYGQGLTSSIPENFHQPESAVVGTKAGVIPALQLALGLRRGRSELDGISLSTRPSRRQIVTLVLAVVLVGSVGVLSAKSYLKEKELLGRLQQGRVAQQPQPPVSWRKEDMPRILAVNAAVRELNLPVGKLLAAIQPSADMEVALLSIEFLAARGEDDTSVLKIVAETRVAGEMARYVALLPSRAPLVQAHLSSHEISENLPMQPYRFSVEAKWVE